MAYENFRASQPYDQLFNSVVQAPYHDNYDPTLDSRAPAVPPVPVPPYQPPSNQQSPPPPPPPIAAPPNKPIPFPDPSRFYQNSNNNPLAPEPPGTAFQQKLDVSPEIIAQITSSVIQQLQGLNFVGNIPRQAPEHPSQNSNLSPFTPSVSEISQSSPTTANKIYTPPSPFRHVQDGPYQSPQFSNPQFAQKVQNFPQTLGEQERIPRPYLDGANDQRPRLSRPPTQDETPVEKIWGQLFDKDGMPTARLGQFLRGIAVHLIEAYPPGNTIVVTPEKMQKYYEDTKSPTDPYLWKGNDGETSCIVTVTNSGSLDIFDDRTSSISRLYRDVQAEHHLVQDRLDERPDIPGLTPRGFERWMRLMIVARPDQEYQRLQRTVLEMPINNPDDPKERFPKELPRRLFPKSPDQDVKEHLERSILTHCHVNVPKTVDRDQSQPNTHRRRPTPSIGTPPPNADPRLSSPFEDDDEDEPAPTRPIERERKPYSVQLGGKFYEDNLKANLNSHVEQTKYRDFGIRGGRQSPSTGNKHDSKDFANRDADFVKTPVSARFREDDEVRYRKDERVHDHLREREFERDRHSEHPSRGSWDTDEEDYYRATGTLGGRSGRRSPAYDENQWPFR
ncbi:predicted protein [Uncinocarpus reesii 1704]|uniref:DUF7514 domain-containing protein n=1 Tax=Uncinocarpus reesii (strain UAMH 1704) TaxID=336963 RepID=C4JV71_UNCRE|nr:uncharacterized protein UREG_06463 [Uncinocarpus reesii 1704]EEP81598.1 predicted protein [Uncinocarpus reesii 1704]